MARRVHDDGDPRCVRLRPTTMPPTHLNAPRLQVRTLWWLSPPGLPTWPELSPNHPPPPTDAHRKLPCGPERGRSADSGPYGPDAPRRSGDQARQGPRPPYGARNSSCPCRRRGAPGRIKARRHLEVASREWKSAGPRGHDCAAGSPPPSHHARIAMPSTRRALTCYSSPLLDGRGNFLGQQSDEARWRRLLGGGPARLVAIESGALPGARRRGAARQTGVATPASEFGVPHTRRGDQQRAPRHRKNKNDNDKSASALRPASDRPSRAPAGAAWLHAGRSVKRAANAAWVLHRATTGPLRGSASATEVRFPPEHKSWPSPRLQSSVHPRGFCFRWPFGPGRRSTQHPM